MHPEGGGEVLGPRDGQKWLRNPAEETEILGEARALEGGAGALLESSWAYRGEDDVWVAPHRHLVQTDGDPEDHTDGGAPPPQVVELQAEGAGMRARLHQPPPAQDSRGPSPAT